MPATTPKGYPYPLGTDRLTDGDDAIHSLATAVDTKLGVACSGVTVVNVVTANTAVIVAVTFPAGLFTATPNCVATWAGTAIASTTCAIAQPTTTGMNVSGVRAGPAALNVHWYAVQAF